MQPWDQFPGEDPLSFALFRSWLHSRSDLEAWVRTRRGTITTEQARATAQRFNWAARSTAWDLHLADIAAEAERELAEIRAELRAGDLRLARARSRLASKAASKAEGLLDMDLDGPALPRMLQALAVTARSIRGDLGGEATRPPAQSLDLSGLSDEELEAYHRIQAKITPKD